MRLLAALWPSLLTPRALINSIPREAKRREADQSSPMHVVLVTILPPWSYLAFQLPKGAAEEPVGPGWSLSWATGLPMAKSGAWSRPSWQGPRLCVCMCACVFAVQCDSGVGMLVLGGSSFLC